MLAWSGVREGRASAESHAASRRTPHPSPLPRARWRGSPGIAGHGTVIRNGVAARATRGRFPRPAHGERVRVRGVLAPTTDVAGSRTVILGATAGKAAGRVEG